MQSLRLNALHNLLANTKTQPGPKSQKITSIFGENVFTIKKARKFLSDEAYKSLLSSIKSLGRYKKCYPLYSLVPAFNRGNRGKT